MDLLNLPHLQESARRAAGSFLSPLTNAIGEQRRLVDSLTVVSKVRVEECKHMMVWSKSQVQNFKTWRDFFFVCEMGGLAGIGCCFC